MQTGEWDIVPSRIAIAIFDIAFGRRGAREVRALPDEDQDRVAEVIFSYLSSNFRGLMIDRLT